MDSLASREHEDWTACPVCLVLKVTQDCRVSRVCQDYQAARATRERTDCQACLVPEAGLGQMVCPAYREYVESRDCLALRDRPDYQA